MLLSQVQIYVFLCLTIVVLIPIIYDLCTNGHILNNNLWEISYVSVESIVFGSRPRQTRQVLNLTEALGMKDPEALLDATLRNSSWRDALTGTIWPLNDVTEGYDRIQEQLELIDAYRNIKNAIGGVQEPKVILGVGQLNLHSFTEGQAPFLADGCPKDWCIATRNLTTSQTADAVLISEYGWFTRPRPRKPRGQIWIAQHLESPKYNRINTRILSRHINWTASYRRESHIVTNYGSYKKLQPDEVLPTPVNKNYAAHKTRLVAMLVSNCHPANDRMNLANQLSKYIPVDIYGDCGRYKCPQKIKEDNVSCTDWLSRTYKFYLAFENSNCKDYITEKLFANALNKGILPIVYGAAKEDYAAVAPPHSYIHVKDFGSLQELAGYLEVLDANDTLYNEYFAWREHWGQLNQRYWCRLCTLLHLQSDVGYTHSYRDYHHWWNGVCHVTTGQKWLHPFIICSAVVLALVITVSSFLMYGEWLYYTRTTTCVCYCTKEEVWKKTENSS